MHQLDKFTERSVLASLRALVPQRPLAPWETLRIAELQANRLLERFQIETVTVPEEIVSELPRIRVCYEANLPISGSAHWNGRYWIITLSDEEPHVRQRFSLIHEFKHVLDHTTKDYLYRDRPFQSATEQAERVADYFAACLLMPKRIVKRLWYSGHQDILSLSARLQVSPPALRYRLDQLGITERISRCQHPVRTSVERPRYLEPILAPGGSRCRPRASTAVLHGPPRAITAPYAPLSTSASRPRIRPPRAVRQRVTPSPRSARPAKARRKA